MNASALLLALLQYGPTIIPLAAKLADDVRRGDKPVSPEDFAELLRLSNQTAEEIYARLGIQPPPASTTNPR